jgi:hypothetical protein
MVNLSDLMMISAIKPATSSAISGGDDFVVPMTGFCFAGEMAL